MIFPRYVVSDDIILVYYKFGGVLYIYFLFLFVGVLDVRCHKTVGSYCSATSS